MKKFISLILFGLLFSGVSFATYCSTAELDYNYAQTDERQAKVDVIAAMDASTYETWSIRQDALNAVKSKLDELYKEHARLRDVYQNCSLNSSSTSTSTTTTTNTTTVNCGTNSYASGTSCMCKAGYERTDKDDPENFDCKIKTSSTSKITSTSNSASELSNAISWMYSKGLTKFNEPISFMSENGLRRDEASKFFVQYAKNVMGMTPNITKTSCDFSDLGSAWIDLKDIIKESCQLGLFQGSKGMFMPTQKLTNAQAITVFIRLIDGYKNENVGHFANEYYSIAQSLGLLDGLNLNNKNLFDSFTTRGEVAKLLFRGKDK